MKKLDLLEAAKRIAESLGHAFIGTEHILTAYYLVYNPDIARVLIKRIKERIGTGTPTRLDFINDRTTAVVDATKSSDNVTEMILTILTNPYATGARFLRR
jgi:hypothetical protein